MSQKPSAVAEEDLGYDPYTIQRELDRTKTQIFLGDNAAFLGSIMSSLEFVWSYDIPTAATNGSTFWWNPEWFMELLPETRKTVLLHELWHVARLHMLRRGTRDPLIWNYACDIRINNDLENEHRSFEGTSPWLDQSYGLMPEEDIYDALIQKGMKPWQPTWGIPGSGSGPGNGQGVDLGDMIPMDSGDEHTLVNNVVRAIHQAKLSSKGCGSLPGDIEQLVEQFLAPVIPWEAELKQFFTDLLEEDYSWARPNRRFQDIYLPSRFTDEGRLEHLMYFQDVSGSISDQDIIRFNSELKYVWDTFQPVKMTVVQFDTRITKVDVFNEGDPYSSIHIVGRGGTDLRPVREYILKHRPTAAVIFTDLCCPPMETLPIEVPIIWACTMSGMSVPFGKLIRVTEPKKIAA